MLSYIRIGSHDNLQNTFLPTDIKFLFENGILKEICCPKKVALTKMVKLCSLRAPFTIYLRGSNITFQFYSNIIWYLALQWSMPIVKLILNQIVNVLNTCNLRCKLDFPVFLSPFKISFKLQLTPLANFFCRATFMVFTPAAEGEMLVPTSGLR